MDAAPAAATSDNVPETERQASVADLAPAQVTCAAANRPHTAQLRRTEFYQLTIAKFFDCCDPLENSLEEDCVIFWAGSKTGGIVGIVDRKPFSRPQQRVIVESSGTVYIDLSRRSSSCASPKRLGLPRRPIRCATASQRLPKRCL